MKRMLIGAMYAIAFSGMAYAAMAPDGQGGSGAMRPPANRQETAGQAAAPDTRGLRQILTFARELNLTDEQISAVNKLRTDVVREFRIQYQAQQKLVKTLSEILNQDTPDFAAARKQLTVVTSALEQMQRLSIDALAEAYARLTDAQKQKLAALRTQLNKSPSRPTPPQEASLYN